MFEPCLLYIIQKVICFTRSRRSWQALRIPPAPGRVFPGWRSRWRCPRCKGRGRTGCRLDPWSCQSMFPALSMWPSLPRDRSSNQHSYTPPDRRHPRRRQVGRRRRWTFHCRSRPSPGCRDHWSDRTGCRRPPSGGAWGRPPDIPAGCQSRHTGCRSGWWRWC